MELPRRREIGGGADAERVWWCISFNIHTVSHGGTRAHAGSQQTPCARVSQMVWRACPHLPSLPPIGVTNKPHFPYLALLLGASLCYSWVYVWIYEWHYGLERMCKQEEGAKREADGYCWSTWLKRGKMLVQNGKSLCLPHLSMYTF